MKDLRYVQSLALCSVTDQDPTQPRRILLEFDHAGATELGARSSTSERIRLVIDLRSAEQLVRLLAEEGVSAQPEPPPTAWQ